MGIYRAGSDGKAPKGLKVNDYVVTGGGTYVINGVNSDGTYVSAMHNPNQTTYNYTGAYDTLGQPNISPAQQAAQATSPASAAWGQTGSNIQSGAVNTAQGTEGTTYVSHRGQGQLNYDPATGRLIRTMSDGRAWYVDPTDAKYSDLYREYFDTTGRDPRGLFGGQIATGEGMMASAANSNAPYIAGIQEAAQQLAASSPPAYQPADTAAQRAQLEQYLAELGDLTYTPVDRDEFMSRVGSYEGYVQQAFDALSPRYKGQYQRAYDTAAQNLGRAGIFDSLYGQALITQQQNAVTDALMAEAATLGLDLRQRAYDEAFGEYQAAVGENQFATSQRANTLAQAGNMMMNYIGVLNDEAKARNDYNIQSYLAKMQQFTAIIDANYKAGTLTSAEYENMLTVAKIELSKVEAELTTAQVANTQADTEKIKAQTAAINAELAGLLSGGGGYTGSGYGYGSGGGGDGGLRSLPSANAALWDTGQSKSKSSSQVKAVNDEINGQIQSGNYQGALTTLNNKGGVLSDAQYAQQLNKINTAEAARAALQELTRKAANGAGPRTR